VSGLAPVASGIAGAGVRATLEHRPLHVGFVLCVGRFERIVLPRDPRALRMSGSHARRFPARVIRNAETRLRARLSASLRRRIDLAVLNIAAAFSTPDMR
jgi:hypothetical protein